MQKPTDELNFYRLKQQIVASLPTEVLVLLALPTLAQTVYNYTSLNLLTSLLRAVTFEILLKTNELNVLSSELTSLNPSAKVYKQLGSGGVLFLANKATLVKETQDKLANVQQELKQAEERRQ